MSCMSANSRCQALIENGFEKVKTQNLQHATQHATVYISSKMRKLAKACGGCAGMLLCCCGFVGIKGYHARVRDSKYVS